MLCHAVTLTFDPLNLKVCRTSSDTWSKSVRNLSEIEHVPAELLIIFRICAHVMSRCDLDLWPLDLELLQHFGCHAFKLCTKFERNWIIHGWVIEDLALLRCAILRSEAFLPNGSEGRINPTSQTWRGHMAIILTQEVCCRVQILCCIFKRGRLKVEWCWKRRQISHILTPTVKIRWWIGEISIPIVAALHTTEPSEYIWWPSTARVLSAVDW